MKNLGIVIVVLIGLLILVACGAPPKEPAPSFTSFEVSPDSLCLNAAGANLVRVKYKFDPDGWNNKSALCVGLYANENKLWEGGLHFSCYEQGTTGELTFNVTEVFGANVPSQIDVVGRLRPSLELDNSYDEETRTVSTITNCEDPGLK